MLDDRQLLRRYAEGADASFTELVIRHLPLVYSAALRQTGGDAHLAKDIAQQVFIDLARKAGSLPENMVLAGWLHRATRFAFQQALRAERRRLVREQESFSMNMSGAETDPDWEQVRPCLDEALDQMNPQDRDALLLRFFEQRSLAEVGAALGTGEDAARKRVARALDKLRNRLARRGITTSLSALSVAMTAKGVQSAPASLAGSISAASLAAGGVVVTGISAFHIIRILTMSQMKTAIVAVLAVAGITTALMERHAIETLRAENRGLLEQSKKSGDVQAENERLSSLAAQAQRASLSKDQVAELARLRGKVGQLQDNLRKALASAHSANASQNPTPAKSDPDADSAQPFTAAYTTQLANKQTLLAGGWTTAPGFRTFVLMTPNITPGNGVKTQQATDGSQVTIPNAEILFDTSTLEVPEGLLSQLGLDQYRADGHDSSLQSVLAPADAEALLNALKTPTDGVTVSHGRINTADGMAATMSVIGTSDASPGAQTAAPQYSIGLTPNLTEDQTGMNLSINVQVVRPRGAPSTQ